MKLKVDGLLVYFPYDKIYPEQMSYMQELKHTLDAKGHILLEMPSHMGKTTALLSLIVAYMEVFPDKLSKLVYCCCTVAEVDKVVEELSKLMVCYEKECGQKQKDVFARVVVCSYQDLLDPKIGKVVEKEIPKNSVVVFDEAHNIDKECIASMSIKINQLFLLNCAKNIQDLEKTVSELIKGLREASETDSALVNPVLPVDILDEAVPGNIQRAEHFIAFMKRVVNHLKLRLQLVPLVQESPARFLQDIHDKVCIDQKAMSFASERLTSLFRTLKIPDLEVMLPLVTLSHFVTLVSTYKKGFTIIIEPSEDQATNLVATYDSTLFFSCLDASYAMKPIFNRFQTVVMTSGTLSPLTMYPKLLDFQTIKMKSITMSRPQPSILPMIVTRGNDQVAFKSGFESRQGTSVVRNYGNLLLEVVAFVPDGVVCFFPSYGHLDSVVVSWREEGILDQLPNKKLLFIETLDAAENSLVLGNYVKAGRGAVLLCVARGKLSQVPHFLGRAILMFGIPFVRTQSRILNARMKYLEDQKQIREFDFLTFDVMRHAAQCLGRCIRGKTDYGIMIFADKGFSRLNMRSKLPKWIQDQLTDSQCDLSSEEAVQLAKRWLRQMAQPLTRGDQLGTSLVTSNQLPSE